MERSQGSLHQCKCPLPLESSSKNSNPTPTGHPSPVRLLHHLINLRSSRGEYLRSWIRRRSSARLRPTSQAHDLHGQSMARPQAMGHQRAHATRRPARASIRQSKRRNQALGSPNARSDLHRPRHERHTAHVERPRARSCLHGVCSFVSSCLLTLDPCTQLT